MLVSGPTLAKAILHLSYLHELARAVQLPACTSTRLRPSIEPAPAHWGMDVPAGAPRIVPPDRAAVFDAVSPRTPRRRPRRRRTPIRRCSVGRRAPGAR